MYSLETLLQRDVVDPRELGKWSRAIKMIFLPDELKLNPEFKEETIRHNIPQPTSLRNSENESLSEELVKGWGNTEDLTRRHKHVPESAKLVIHCRSPGLPGENKLSGLNRSTKNTSVSGKCGDGLSMKIDRVCHLEEILSSSRVTDR